MDAAPAPSRPRHLVERDEWFRVASRYSLSCMSNAKWLKVLTAVAAAPVTIRRCELKCIGSAWVATAFAAPRVNERHPGHLADGAFQPLEYKWIEWFRFPRRFQPKPGVGYFVQQDVETLRDAILAAADACVELDDEHLYLYGYRGA